MIISSWRGLFFIRYFLFLFNFGAIVILLVKFIIGAGVLVSVLVIEDVWYINAIVEYCFIYVWLFIVNIVCFNDLNAFFIVNFIDHFGVIGDDFSYCIYQSYYYMLLFCCLMALVSERYNARTHTHNMCL